MGPLRKLASRQPPESSNSSLAAMAKPTHFSAMVFCGRPSPDTAPRPICTCTTRDKPVPTRGGAICCNPRLLPPGPMDQRPVEQRHDVLVYTSTPLETGLEVTGTVRVTLWVSTTARDTDFTAKLVDVAPGGIAPRRHRWHPPAPLPRRTRPARARNTRTDLSHCHRRRRHQYGLPRRTSHPPRDLQQQFPSIRSQPKHRAGHRRGYRTANRPPDRLSRRSLSIGLDAARRPWSRYFGTVAAPQRTRTPASGPITKRLYEKYQASRTFKVRAMKPQKPTFSLAGETWTVIRYTRHWIHYGLIAFTILCSVIAALRGAVTPR